MLTYQETLGDERGALHIPGLWKMAASVSTTSLFTPLSTSASWWYCLGEITVFYPSLCSFFCLFIHQYAYCNIYNKLDQLKITESVILCQLATLLYQVGWIRGEGLRHAGPPCRSSSWPQWALNYPAHLNSCAGLCCLVLRFLCQFQRTSFYLQRQKAHTLVHNTHWLCFIPTADQCLGQSHVIYETLRLHSLPASFSKPSMASIFQMP